MQFTPRNDCVFTLTKNPHANIELAWSCQTSQRWVQGRRPCWAHFQHYRCQVSTLTFSLSVAKNLTPISDAITMGTEGTSHWDTLVCYMLLILFTHPTSTDHVSQKNDRNAIFVGWLFIVVVICLIRASFKTTESWYHCGFYRISASHEHSYLIDD